MKTARGTWIQTRTGKRFDPLNPKPSDIDPVDICHALACVNRFTGHTREPYSVAQHSVMVSRLCDPADALWGLLHDASEAYVADVSAPVKRSPKLAGYREVESAVMLAVCERFGLAPTMPESVARADMIALAVEARDQMSPLDPEWAEWLEGIEVPRYYRPFAPNRDETLEPLVSARRAVSWQCMREVFARKLGRLIGDPKLFSRLP